MRTQDGATGPAIKAMRVVIVDDRPGSVALLEAQLASRGLTNVVGYTDSRAGLDACLDEPPDLVLLDLHMPAPDGLEFLGALDGQIKDAVSLPVIVMTGETALVSKHEALAAGARDYLTKPYDSDEVYLKVHNALRVRAQQLDEVLTRLARAGEFRDDATGEHTRRVATTSALIAEGCGAGEALARDLRLAAPLHDIGKIAVPDRILRKPGRLTPAEYETMKRHTEAGGRILEGTGSGVMQLARKVALSHHERWDGTGYPYRLAGGDIPLSGRIVAIADVFDALTHERPYKEAWSVELSVAEMELQRGRQFDPALLDVFLELDHAALV